MKNPVSHPRGFLFTEMFFSKAPVLLQLQEWGFGFVTVNPAASTALHHFRHSSLPSKTLFSFQNCFPACMSLLW